MEVRPHLGEYLLHPRERHRLAQFDKRTEVTTANIFWLMKRISQDNFSVATERNGIGIAISPQQVSVDSDLPPARAVQVTVTYPSTEENHLDVTEFQWVDHPTLDASIKITTSDQSPNNEFLTTPTEDAIHHIPDGRHFVDVDYFNSQPKDPQETARIARLNSRLAIAYSLAFTMMRDHEVPARVPRPAPLPTRRATQQVFAG